LRATLFPNSSIPIPFVCPRHQYRCNIYFHPKTQACSTWLKAVDSAVVLTLLREVHSLQQRNILLLDYFFQQVRNTATADSHLDRQHLTSTIYALQLFVFLASISSLTASSPAFPVSTGIGA